MNDRITIEDWNAKYKSPYPLRELRKARGVAIAQIAEHLQISVSMVHKLETGQIMVNTRYLAQLAEALGVTIEEIVGAVTTS